MAKPLRVLLVDDSEDEALLLLRELRRGGFDADSLRKDTPEEFDRALSENRSDIVITDHNMPRFSSAAALSAVLERDTDLPVILHSGSIGEDIAVAAMRSGANDYIMKDNPARLVPAINRELREVDNRRAHRQAENMIRHLDLHDALTGLANCKQFDFRIAQLIELSGASLSDNSVLAYIPRQVEAYRVPDGKVCFEINETAVIANMKTAVDFIRRIREADCLFALDDSGSGMSSFTDLKTLPVDYLKIDGEFMRDIATDPMDEAIVEVVNCIGHAAGLRTIGEHVEDLATLGILARIGVDFAQGYGIQRPQPVPEAPDA